VARGESILRELLQLHGSRPEPYLKLWNLYYHQLKDYNKAYDIAESAFIRSVSALDLSAYKIALFIIYAKSLFRLKRYETLFEVL
jgi:hypothetical protein